MAITIDIQSPDLDILLAKLKAYPTEMAETIKTAMNSVGPTALGEIVENRFTGEGPFPPWQRRLGVRKGLLRTSLNWKPARAITIGGQLVEVKGAMGSPVIYFPVHEFGYSGSQKIGAFSRRKSGSKKRSRRTQPVKTFSREVNYPARAPLWAGTVEEIDQFTAAITTGLTTMWSTP